MIDESAGGYLIPADYVPLFIAWAHEREELFKRFGPCDGTHGWGEPAIGHLALHGERRAVCDFHYKNWRHRFVYFTGGI